MSSSPAQRSKNIRRELDVIITNMSVGTTVTTNGFCKQLSSRRRNVQIKTMVCLLGERTDMKLIESGRWIKIVNEPRLEKTTVES